MKNAMTVEAKKKHAADEAAHVYADVYRVLMAGMAASTACFAVGVVLALMHPAYVPLTADWVRAHYNSDVVLSGLYAGDPAAYMLLGVMLLILTPVCRVVVSIYVFLRERDYKYATITGTVLGVMALTVILSHFGLR